VAGALVQSGCPAVLAMQTQISEEAALQFAGVFYETFAEGAPIDAAVAEGRKTVDLVAGSAIEWAIPQLHMRVRDGLLFKLVAPRTVQRPPVSPARRDEAPLDVAPAAPPAVPVPPIAHGDRTPPVTAPVGAVPEGMEVSSSMAQASQWSCPILRSTPVQ
jgi:hypothetical protein